MESGVAADSHGQIWVASEQPYLWVADNLADER